eukprot:scaffold447_cov307-Pinguiococcus_pyrenoidosus.AAC.70
MSSWRVQARAGWFLTTRPHAVRSKVRCASFAQAVYCSRLLLPTGYSPRHYAPPRPLKARTPLGIPRRPPPPMGGMPPGALPLRPPIPPPPGPRPTPLASAAPGCSVLGFLTVSSMLRMRHAASEAAAKELTLFGAGSHTFDWNVSVMPVKEPGR